MISADALIHAVHLRMQLVAPHWRRRPGDFPPGWQQWLDSIHERVGAVTGASADAVVAVFLQRPLATPPPRLAELTRWQAFNTLWRQEWHAEQPDAVNRRLHWFAAGTSAVWHLFLLVMFAWLVYLDLTRVDSPPPKGEEIVIQVEYVGDGTPGEVGGGPEPEPVEAEPAPTPETTTTTAAPSDQASSLPTVALLPSTVSPPTLQAPPMEVVQRDIPVRTPEAVDQPLIVSEPVPDRNDVFVLPPPAPRIEVPMIAMPELTAPASTVEIVEIPNPVRPTAQALPQSRIEQPVLQAQVPTVVVREIPSVAPRLPTPVVRQPEMVAPELQAQIPQVRPRAIPSPPEPSPAPAPEAAPTEARPVAETAGPEKIPAPGGWPTPERADDWGAAERDRPGAQSGEPPGLYDSDGSVRLAETPGSASPGQPPGTITEEIADLDRVGTWLRRPPNDYEPTVFDQYWRPDETLLAEWVRKSVTTIRIPIPGTSKSIVCKTVLLIVGGACGIDDPNLNDQPATARPPPDIPFKPELQEGSGSVPPAGDSAD